MTGAYRPAQPIGIAVIGAGYWGPNLVRTALATAELQLKWLCDLDVARARGRARPVLDGAGHRFLRGGPHRPGSFRGRDRDPGRHALRSGPGRARSRKARAGGKTPHRVGR